MTNITTKETTMLGVNILFPHEKNPRKNLGDLTELTASIRANGVLQNLTVIEDPDRKGYKVLIGHRRLAAAKAAGLAALPCYIMRPTPDEKTQILIMLSENMQRNDLTLEEEADGLQYAFDLGASVQDLADRTGLSDQTIRNRLNITKLDRSVIQSKDFQLSITDYIELAKIPDVDKRNKILKNSSSPDNLKWNIRREIESAAESKKKKALTDKLEELGFQKRPELSKRLYNSMKYLSLTINPEALEEILKDIDPNDPLIFYTIDPWNISIKKAITEEEATEAQLEAEKRKEKEAKSKANLDGVKKEIKLFLVNALNGKVNVKDKDEISALKEFRKAVLDGDSDPCAAKDIVNLCEGRSSYLTPSEKEMAKYKPLIDKMSVELHMFFSEYRWKREWVIYTTNYKKGFRDLVVKLKKHGFELPKDLESWLK